MSQVLIDEAYVCSINVRGRDNIDIPAGRSFIREALVEHSFNTLKAQGYLTRFQREQPIQPIGKSTSRKLAGIDNETPDAAMNPPKQTEQQKIAAIREQAQSVANAKAVKAQATADKAQSVANDKATIAEDEAKAQKALKKVEKAKEPVVKKENTVQQIWIADPELLKTHSFEQLLSLYRSVCAEQEPKLVPEKFVKKDGGKEKLIAQLSKDYISK